MQTIEVLRIRIASVHNILQAKHLSLGIYEVQILIWTIDITQIRHTPNFLNYEVQTQHTHTQKKIHNLFLCVNKVQDL